MTRPFDAAAAKAVMVPVLGRFNRVYIRHCALPKLAWTGSAWDCHEDGIPTGDFQICNFYTFAAAQKYIDSFSLTLNAGDSATTHLLEAGGKA